MLRLQRGALAVCMLAAALGTAHAATPARVLIEANTFGAQTLPRYVGLTPTERLAASTLLKACAMPLQQRHGAWLEFDVQSGRCRMLAHGGAPGRLDAFAGRAADGQIRRELAERGYAVVLQGPRAPRPKVACSCPPNRPPNGAVECASQSAHVARAIAPVHFLAVDPDGDTLFTTLSHALDAAPAQEGVPEGLYSTCFAAPGAVDCRITGRVTGSSGVLSLFWSASDDEASIMQSASITLQPAPGDLLMRDDFDFAACP